MRTGWFGDLASCSMVGLLVWGLAVRTSLTAQPAPPNNVPDVPPTAVASTPAELHPLSVTRAPPTAPNCAADRRTWRGTLSFEQLEAGTWQVEGVTLSWSLPVASDLGSKATANAGQGTDPLPWLSRLAWPLPARAETALQVRRLAWGREIEATGLALNLTCPPNSDAPAGNEMAAEVSAERSARIECTLERLRGWGLTLQALRLVGRGLPEAMAFEGEGLLGPQRFACTAQVEPPAKGGDRWRARFELRGPELVGFPLPRSWFAEAGAVKLTGRFSAQVQGEWVPKQTMRGELSAAIELDRVALPDWDLELENVRWNPAFHWADGLQPTPPTELRVGAITSGPARLEALRLRVQGEGRSIRLELVGAQFCGGRVWSEPVVWEPVVGPVTLQFRLAEIDLAQVAALFPKFQGRIEGRVGGELPVVWHPEGRWTLEAGRLALQPGAPAELHYAAEGLLTANLPPDSPRYRQMRLVEQALRRLRLESLEVRVHAARPREGLLQLQLRGVSETPEAIVPVDFRLNVRGDLEEVIRLWGRRW